MPRKSSIPLTATRIRSAHPNSFVWDSELPGFGLRVTKAGSRSFVARFRMVTGVQGQITLGGFPALTVDEARAMARVALGKVERDINPSTERSMVRTSLTLADIADNYCGEYALSANLRPRTISDARRVLDRFAVPTLGKLKVADIRPPDIRRVHGEARAESGVYQANRLLAVLGRMFSLAVENELRATNPCRGVRKFAEEQRWRNLSEDEVARLLEACGRCDNQNAANAVCFLLLTGARLQEVLKAEWAQFDLETGLWTKPSAHTKQKRQHRLNLAGPALALLREIRMQTACEKFLFPGKDAEFDPSKPNADLRRPRADLKRAWRWLVKEAELPGVRIHDLRRTTASFMLDEQVHLTVIGSALGHTQLSTTLRYAQLRQTAQSEGLSRAGTRMMISRERPIPEVLEEGSIA